MLDVEVGHVDFLTSSVSVCASTPLHGILTFVSSVPRCTSRDKNSCWIGGLAPMRAKWLLSVGRS